MNVLALGGRPAALYAHNQRLESLYTLRVAVDVGIGAELFDDVDDHRQARSVGSQGHVFGAHSQDDFAVAAQIHIGNGDEVIAQPHLSGFDLHLEQAHGR